MNKKLDKKLCKDFPKLFAQRNLPMTQTCMCWGFECGDGWYNLIYRLCEEIQGYIDNNKHLKIPQVEVTQVKEKYGTLRFYYDGGNEKIDGMVWLAEGLSAYICENCGHLDSKNTLKGKGWIYNMCNTCWDKKNNSAKVKSEGKKKADINDKTKKT